MLRSVPHDFPDCSRLERPTIRGRGRPRCRGVPRFRAARDVKDLERHAQASLHDVLPHQVSHSSDASVIARTFGRGDGRDGSASIAPPEQQAAPLLNQAAQPQRSHLAKAALDFTMANRDFSWGPLRDHDRGRRRFFGQADRRTVAGPELAAEARFPSAAGTRRGGDPPFLQDHRAVVQRGAGRKIVTSRSYVSVAARDAALE